MSERSDTLLLSRAEPENPESDTKAMVPRITRMVMTTMSSTNVNQAIFRAKTTPSPCGCHPFMTEGEELCHVERSDSGVETSLFIPRLRPKTNKSDRIFLLTLLRNT